MSITSAPPMSELAKLAEMRAWARYASIARVAGFVAILCMPFSLWALFWSSPRDYPFLSSMLCVPIVTYAYILLFNRLWSRDRFLKLLFGAGIAARFAAAGVYVWMGFFLYDAAVDAFHYWSVGLDLAEQFSAAGWAAFRPPYWNTNLLYNICGIITLVTGNALPTLFVTFALAALLGGYFFYRAFCLAFPLGNTRLYGLLVVFLPSILFWSSAIGKDALAQLFIGITAYGFARIVRKVNVWPVLICVMGIAGAAAVRPHIGAMLAIAVLGPFTLGRTRTGWMGTSVKLLLVPILAAATVYMVGQAATFVGLQSDDFRGGINRLDLEHKNTNLGGSVFSQGQSLPSRIIAGPFLMFRPFPWEVHSQMAALSALEGLALAWLTWRKRRNILELIRQWREPFVGFILLYTLEFSVIFSAATSNFGILVRQRIMLVPIALMLLCAKRSTFSVAGRRSVMQQNPRAYVPVSLSTAKP